MYIRTSQIIFLLSMYKHYTYKKGIHIHNVHTFAVLNGIKLGN